jgi:predicted  nucleic acid-binding Zn-ribbon protein
MAAAKQARQEANESRAAAIEATIQRRQLLDRFYAFGGVPVLDKVDDLEKRLETARQELQQVTTKLAEITADRQADQQHIEDLREWGEGLADHIRDLEQEQEASSGDDLGLR